MPTINPLRLDPTRTTTERNVLIAEMGRRCTALRRAIRQLVVEEDAFGIAAREATEAARAGQSALTTVVHTTSLDMVMNTKFMFDTDEKKVAAYQEWFKNEVKAGLLEVDPANEETPWLSKNIKGAYKKGALRAYMDANKGKGDNLDFLAGGKSQFMKNAFDGPVAEGKMKALYTRSFTQLKGVTAQMDADMSRILAQGLAQGKSAAAVAKDLEANVSGLEKKRCRTIARTEIVHAHNEGQLDAFEEMNMEGVGVMAEWSTAHDGLVCPQCSPMEGVVLTIKEARGILPRHPNCRCAWIPANVGEHMGGTTKRRWAGPEQGLEAPGTLPTGKTTGQTFSKIHVDIAIRDSIKEEFPKLGIKEARKATKWHGAEKSITGKLNPGSKKALAEAEAKKAAKKAALAAKKAEAEAANQAAASAHGDKVKLGMAKKKYGLDAGDLEALDGETMALTDAGLDKYAAKFNIKLSGEEKLLVFDTPAPVDGSLFLTAQMDKANEVIQAAVVKGEEAAKAAKAAARAEAKIAKAAADAAAEATAKAEAAHAAKLAQEAATKAAEEAAAKKAAQEAAEAAKLANIDTKTADVKAAMAKWSKEAPPTVDVIDAGDFSGIPGWENAAGAQSKQSYGVVLFDDEGRVLLRRPTDDKYTGKPYGGAAWTFAKGGGYKPALTATTEVGEEVGEIAGIHDIIPGTFKGTTGQTNYFVGRTMGYDETLLDLHPETAAVKWVKYEDAVKLINESEDLTVRKRDLAVLEAAYDVAKNSDGSVFKDIVDAGNAKLGITPVAEAVPTPNSVAGSFVSPAEAKKFSKGSAFEGSLYRGQGDVAVFAEGSTGSKAAIANGVYFTEDVTAAANYGDVVAYHTNVKKLLNVDGDAGLKVWKDEAAVWGKKHIDDHLKDVADGKATMDADLLARHIDPGENLSLYLEDHGYGGIKYKHITNDDHHDQIVIFRKDNLVAVEPGITGKVPDAPPLSPMAAGKAKLKAKAEAAAAKAEVPAPAPEGFILADEDFNANGMPKYHQMKMKLEMVGFTEAEVDELDALFITSKESLTPENLKALAIAKIDSAVKLKGDQIPSDLAPFKVGFDDLPVGPGYPPLTEGKVTKALVQGYKGPPTEHSILFDDFLEWTGITEPEELQDTGLWKAVNKFKLEQADNDPKLWNVRPSKTAALYTTPEPSGIVWEPSDILKNGGLKYSSLSKKLSEVYGIPDLEIDNVIHAFGRSVGGGAISKQTPEAFDAFVKTPKFLNKLPAPKVPEPVKLIWEADDFQPNGLPKFETMKAKLMSAGYTESQTFDIDNDILGSVIGLNPEKTKEVALVKLHAAVNEKVGTAAVSNSSDLDIAKFFEWKKATFIDDIPDTKVALDLHNITLLPKAEQSVALKKLVNKYETEYSFKPGPAFNPNQYFNAPPQVVIPTPPPGAVASFDFLDPKKPKLPEIKKALGMGYPGVSHDKLYDEFIKWGGWSNFDDIADEMVDENIVNVINNFKVYKAQLPPVAAPAPVPIPDTIEWYKGDTFSNGKLKGVAINQKLAGYGLTPDEISGFYGYALEKKGDVLMNPGEFNKLFKEYKTGLPGGVPTPAATPAPVAAPAPAPGGYKAVWPPNSTLKSGVLKKGAVTKKIASDFGFSDAQAKKHADAFFSAPVIKAPVGFDEWAAKTFPAAGAKNIPTPAYVPPVAPTAPSVTAPVVSMDPDKLEAYLNGAFEDIGDESDIAAVAKKILEKDNLEDQIKVLGKEIGADELGIDINDFIDDIPTIVKNPAPAPGATVKAATPAAPTMDIKAALKAGISIPGPVQTHPDDKYFDAVLKAAKTVNHHAGDKAYNTSTLAQYATTMNEIKAKLAAGGLDDKTKAMLEYYVKWSEGIDKAKAAGSLFPEAYTTPKYTFQTIYKTPSTGDIVPIQGAGFADIATFEDLGALGGSTGARKVSIKTGFNTSDWVMKDYSGRDLQAENEFFTNSIYNAVSPGSAPVSRLGYVKNRNGETSAAVFNKFVEGGTEIGKTTGAVRTAAEKVARENFVLDAWLANWDTVGLNGDNMMVLPNGKVVRIDNGGSLLFRAQGGLKGHDFGPKVGELETFHDAKLNPSASKLYKGITQRQIADQIESLETAVQEAGGLSSFLEKAGLNAITDEARRKEIEDALHKRFTHLQEVRDKIEGLTRVPMNQRLARLKEVQVAKTNMETHSTKDAANAALNKASVNLKSTELSRIKAYTGNGYGDMNEAQLEVARKGGRATKDVVAINSGIAKLPGYKGILGRGHTSYKAEKWTNWTRGSWAQVHWTCPASSSANPPSVFPSGQHGICYVIRSKGNRNAYVQDISKHYGEHEALNMSDSAFRVVGWAESPTAVDPNGRHYRFIVMDELDAGEEAPFTQEAPVKLDPTELWKAFSNDAKRAEMPGYYQSGWGDDKGPGVNDLMEKHGVARY